MNMETRIDSRLWEAIRNSYESRNYTGAIMDAIYFLSELIREKTGLESDGVSLVGQAFGGKNPKLKVNKLQSESDQNVQKGIEQLLRGLYQAIRNPRSHEKYADSEQDTTCIILFIDYLIRVIDKSKTPFNKNTFISRVLDHDFVEMDRYAQLLVDEIPPKLRAEVAFDIYNRKLEGEGNKLFYFYKALLAVLEKDDVNQLFSAVSEDLKHTEDTDVMRTVLQIFPHEMWLHIEEVARLRVENKLIESMKEGAYSKSKDKCYGGAFGTWASNIFPEFTLKPQLSQLLCNKLNSSDKAVQEYALHYLFPYVDTLFDEPSPLFVHIVKENLEKGDRRFYDALNNNFWFGDDIWTKPFEQTIANFKEADPEPSILDLPFE